MRRPRDDEIAEYYRPYVERVPEGDVLEILARELEETRALLESFGEAGAAFRYGPEKWSVAEVVGHLIDTERVFAYRCLALARGESRALPSFDHEGYVTVAGFGRRALAQLSRELASVRSASLSLFASLSPTEEARTGTISGMPFVVRAIPFVVAGHELHHRDVLIERYLSVLGEAPESGPTGTPEMGKG